MENFCLYSGKKIVKPEIWNITSVELSSDYTSAIIQAESKSNKSEYILDVTQLISNQYVNGVDPYTATIVSELTGAVDWVLDSDNNQIKYTEKGAASGNVNIQGRYYTGTAASTCSQDMALRTQNSQPDYVFAFKSITVDSSSSTRTDFTCFYTVSYKGDTPTDNQLTGYITNPVVEEEQKTLPLDVVAQQVISNAQSGDGAAQNSIVSTFNNITDGILTSDYSEFFEQNKQPK